MTQTVEVLEQKIRQERRETERLSQEIYRAMLTAVQAFNEHTLEPRIQATLAIADELPRLIREIGRDPDLSEGDRDHFAERIRSLEEKFARVTTTLAGLSLMVERVWNVKPLRAEEIRKVALDYNSAPLFLEGDLEDLPELDLAGLPPEPADGC